MTNLSVLGTKRKQSGFSQAVPPHNIPSCPVTIKPLQLPSHQDYGHRVHSEAPAVCQHHLMAHRSSLQPSLDLSLLFTRGVHLGLRAVPGTDKALLLPDFHLTCCRSMKASLTGGDSPAAILVQDLRAWAKYQPFSFTGRHPANLESGITCGERAGQGNVVGHCHPLPLVPVVLTQRGHLGEAAVTGQAEPGIAASPPVPPGGAGDGSQSSNGKIQASENPSELTRRRTDAVSTSTALCTEGWISKVFSSR